MPSEHEYPRICLSPRFLRLRQRCSTGYIISSSISNVVHAHSRLSRIHIVKNFKTCGFARRLRNEYLAVLYQDRFSPHKRSNIRPSPILRDFAAFSQSDLSSFVGIMKDIDWTVKRRCGDKIVTYNDIFLFLLHHIRDSYLLYTKKTFI